MSYIKLKAYIEDVLCSLEQELTYHNAAHTLNDVLPAAIRLANKFNVNKDDILLLKTAILFHDLGYLKQYDKNEPIGAKMAEEILPNYNYSNEQIEIIKKLILSTQLPQEPSTLLEKIICDADLDSLHRNDFFDLGEKLRTELNYHKEKINKKDWLKIQLVFMNTHKYHTVTDVDTRNTGKLKNIKLLEKALLEY